MTHAWSARKRFVRISDASISSPMILKQPKEPPLLLSRYQNYAVKQQIFSAFELGGSSASISMTSAWIPQNLFVYSAGFMGCTWTWTRWHLLNLRSHFRMLVVLLQSQLPYKNAKYQKIACRQTALVFLHRQMLYKHRTGHVIFLQRLLQPTSCREWNTLLVARWHMFNAECIFLRRRRFRVNYVLFSSIRSMKRKGCSSPLSNENFWNLSVTISLRFCAKFCMTLFDLECDTLCNSWENDLIDHKTKIHESLTVGMCDFQGPLLTTTNVQPLVQKISERLLIGKLG